MTFLNTIFNRAKIDHGSNNTIMQGCTFNNPTIVLGTSLDTFLASQIETLGSQGQYDKIDEIVQSVMQAAKNQHELKQYYTAEYDQKLNKLISTPKTEEALKLYPKKIKGCYTIRYSDYPYMNKQETPWEYAYRTQTEVKLAVSDYQEYLGDIIDPYPIIKNKGNGNMEAIISPMDFPPAKAATLSSGDTTIPFMMRRKASLAYGQIVFGAEDIISGLDLSIVKRDNNPNVTITLDRHETDSLEDILVCERLLANIKKTGELTISLEHEPLFHSHVEEKVLEQPLFKCAPAMVRYLENLLFIQATFHCVFSTHIDSVSIEEYHYSCVIAQSLRNKWYASKLPFEKDLRSDYDKIPEEVLADPTCIGDYLITKYNVRIVLQGVSFSIGEYHSIYRDARLNNVKSIQKNIERKRRAILMTVKPHDGKDCFIKHTHADAISLA